MLAAAQAIQEEISRVPNSAKMEGKYLTFTLPNEDFGIGIIKIKDEDIMIDP